MHTQMAAVTERGLCDFQPAAQGWRSFAWPGGCFDTAARPLTSEVEGTITLCHPTIMAIIDGGCRRIEVASECGHRYQGADFAGAASFLPAGASRHIAMNEVRSQWASLSIRPDLFTLTDDLADRRSLEIAAFTNRRDDFLVSMLGELCRLSGESERLDRLYCDAMAVSAAHYLVRRYGSSAGPLMPATSALPGWRLRRAKEYIAAHLGEQELRLDDIAASVGLSTGFFHRAFKEATGDTPLAYIQRQRIEAAMRLLATGSLPVTVIAMKVGFWSPSHFARLFRRQTGLTPTQYRKGVS
jgi:AraC family transcriptional regulator